MTLQSTRSALGAGQRNTACDVVTEVEPRPGGQASGSLRLCRRHRPRARLRARIGRESPAKRTDAEVDRLLGR
jgi:hypothetical protein